MKTIVGSCLCLLVYAAPVSAQPRPRDEARRLSERASVEFVNHDYVGAVRDFQRAYELSRSGALLYNIAQAYESSGELAHAVISYEAFVREGMPGLPEANQIGLRTHLEELRNRVAAPHPIVPPHETVTPVPSVRVPVTPVRVAVPPTPRFVTRVWYERHAFNRIGPWLTLSAGALSLGVGTALAMHASQLRGQAGDQSQPYNAAAEAGWHANQLAAEVFLGLGVALTGGGILYFLLRGPGERHEERLRAPPAVSFFVSPHTLGLSGSF